ncbi:MAG: helix-turn-helix domain-containing protein [Nocardioidaceae bacterium]
MARRGRPTVEINLTGEERKTLQRWARRHASSQALALRCRIVLACADGERTRDEIAAEVGCNPATVTKWRHRFAGQRLDGLVDAPRPGAARTIGDDVVEAIVVETLETAPPDATHWSTRGLAAKHGISHTTVGEIWRAFGLKPWREDAFKVSPDPELVEKIRDIVGLYMNPPVAAAVTRAPDSGPPVVGVRRPACWAGGQDHDEASPSHARADRPQAAGGRPSAQRREGPRRGAAAPGGVRVELEPLA